MAFYVVVTRSNKSNGEIREHFDTEPEAVNHMNYLRVFDQEMRNKGFGEFGETLKYRIEKV